MVWRFSMVGSAGALEKPDHEGRVDLADRQKIALALRIAGFMSIGAGSQGGDNLGSSVSKCH